MNQEQANKILEESEIEYQKLAGGIEQTRSRQELMNKAFEPLRWAVVLIQEVGNAISNLWIAAKGDDSDARQAGVDGTNILTKLGFSTEAVTLVHDIVTAVSQGVETLKALVAGDWGATTNIFEKMGFHPRRR